MASVRQLARTMPMSPGGRPHVRELDWLMLAVVGLCCLGLMMSVSIVGAAESTPLQVMRAQGSKLLVGLVAFLVCALVPLARIRRLAPYLFGFGVLLCATTRLFFEHRNYAFRWVTLGSQSFQPVELARFCLVILSADLLARAGLRVHTFKHGLLPSVGCAAVLACALLLQPDHGNAILVVVLTSCMALVAGVRFLHFTALAIGGLAMIGVQAIRHPYVVGRLTNFLDVTSGSQVGQGLVALASGGAFGRGLGEGWMKMGFVPEAQNDFVFAIIGEEFGFVGSLLVLALYSIIGFVGYRLVLSMKDPFLRFMVCGFVLLICLQAAMNLMVVSGWAPAKGIDLPFVSTGGTSLVFFLAAVGLIGNAARTDFASATSVSVSSGRM